MYFNGQTNVEKEQSIFYGPGEADLDNHEDHPDPFLYSDSKIMTGQGKAIVCCVGENTLLARNRSPKDLVIEEQFTFLEDKLEKTSRQITKYAMFITMLSVITQFAFLLGVIMTTDAVLFSNETLLKVGKIAIVAVVIMIVAIPEGLPLAVSIAMALSINSLKKDAILIKNLESVQTCAMLHDICVGKTGTLTKGRMTVQKFQLGSQEVQNNDHEIQGADFFNSSQFDCSENMKDLVRESIIANTDVRIQIDNEEYKYEPKGQAVEVGMIQFLIDNKEDLNQCFIDRNQSSPKIIQLPFSQAHKRKVTVRQVQGNANLVRIYVKGAPEYVIALCTQSLNNQVKPVPFGEND